MTDKVQKIREGVEKRYEYWREKEFNSHSIESEIRMSECQHLLLMLDSLQKEPVSEDLISVAKQYVDSHVFGNEEDKFTRSVLVDMFCSGANWQKDKMMAKAVDGKVFANGMGNPILHLWDKGKHLIDKKVKVIVIEEE